MSDPQKYRAREDIKQIQEQRDPIETLAKHLMEQRNCLTEYERIYRNLKPILDAVSD